MAYMGERRGARRDFVGKPEEKSPLGRFICKRGCNIRMELKEILHGSVLAQV
jgi:hypothetical protein